LEENGIKEEGDVIHQENQKKELLRFRGGAFFEK